MGGDKGDLTTKCKMGPWYRKRRIVRKLVKSECMLVNIIPQYFPDFDNVRCEQRRKLGKKCILSVLFL